MAADPVEAFMAEARSYCSLVEAVPTLGRGEFVWRAGEHLAALYMGAVALPDVGHDADDPPKETEMASAEVFAIQDRLREKLGDLDEYSFVFDPWEKGNTAVTGSLADDLSDIYRDMREGITAYEGGYAEEAIWQLRWGLGHHWGIHAARALYAIHWATRTPGEQWIDPGEV